VSERVVLAIETSCDETAVAILRGRELLASEVASQAEIHAEFGGVVPEVASRNHLRVLRPLLERAMESAKVRVADIDGYAATRGPGLASSLMIGTSAAKGLALTTGRFYIGVNHLEGHLVSPFFGSRLKPSVGLLVSGGHTLLIDVEGFGRYHQLGGTVDDAAGEAFDKVGKMLGLPYPAGPEVDRLASKGDPKAYVFPRSMMESGDFSFSFSGLKTSVRYMLPKLRTYRIEDLCASFQEAIVDVLIAKTLHAARNRGRKTVALSGGVSCNTRVRERFAVECEKQGFELLVAEPRYCTDNAAMIGFVAAMKLARGEFSPITLDIDPNLRLV
jgi:N6-L-threonylcarbamoyladenine synthase